LLRVQRRHHLLVHIANQFADEPRGVGAQRAELIAGDGEEGLKVLDLIGGQAKPLLVVGQG
jgi:hypothetical protein